MIKPGCVCFAKVKGYSPWPARINVLPKDVKIPRGKVPVFFYGTHQVSYVSENDIFDFDKYKDIYGTYKGRNIKFVEGMEELTSNPKVLQLGFDKMAIKYLSQYYKFDCISAETLTPQSTENTRVTDVVLHQKKKTPSDNIRIRLVAKRKPKVTKLCHSEEANGGQESLPVDMVAKPEECIEISESKVTEVNLHTVGKSLPDSICTKRPLASDEEEERPFKLVKSSSSSEPNDFLEPGFTDVGPKSAEFNEREEPGDDQTISVDDQGTRQPISNDEEERNCTLFDSFSSIVSTCDLESYPINITDSSDENIHINAQKGKIIENMAEIMSFDPKLELSHPCLKSTPCIILERLNIDLNSISKGYFVDSEKFNSEAGKQNCTVDIDLSEYTGPSLNFPETFQSDQVHSITNITSFKSPIRDIDTKRPKRASAIKFQETLHSYMKEMAHRPQVINNVRNTNICNRVKEERILKHQISHHSKRIKDVSIHAERTHKMSQRPSTGVISADERNLRIVSQLSVIDKEIKRSLIVGQENYDMCEKLMKKLNLLTDLNLTLLCKVPEIVTTMWKCRRYKKYDSIRSSASEMYQRFYQIYEQSDIDERIEAGTELLKRDRNNCKSAQTLMDELFIADTKNPTSRPSVAPLCLSSPGSVPSHQSSAANTPLLQMESESIAFLDPLLVDINELLRNGTLELIECYEAERDFGLAFSGADVARSSFDSAQELYRQLGV